MKTKQATKSVWIQLTFDRLVMPNTRDETICEQHTDEKNEFWLFSDETIYNYRTI